MASDGDLQGKAASDSKEQGKAVLKGFFTRQPAKADWPSDPEEACIKHASFLKLWCPMGFSKPQCRASWKGAFPRLPEGDMNAMINGVAEARKWLNRKHRNQKTGDRTHLIIRDLMVALFGSGGSSPKGQTSTSRRSTSPRGPAAKSSTVESSPRGPAAKSSAVESAEDSQTSTKGSLRRLNTKSPIIFVEQAANAVDADAVSVSSTAITASSKGVLAVGVLLQKKPAMAKKAAKAKQPAKGKDKVLKKPSLKKAVPADGTKKVWHETVSHGLVKVTKASVKAYITFKASDGKEKSLVNVNLGKGEKQSRVMDLLLQKLQTEEVDRDSLLKFKEDLLSRERGEPAKAEAAEGKPAKAKAAKEEPAKAEAAKGEPAKAEAAEGEPEEESLQKAKD
ncbi:unnamed protein product [Symbiodinium sp. CCMP2592]|nr:unnamed protein product [Symbiodinium sp. CCMP2592]